MKEVEVSYVIEGTEEEIRAHLSPESMAEYMGYSIRDTERTDEGDLLRVDKYDTEFTLRVEEVSAGHTFSQYGSDGPFREMNGVLQIEAAPDVHEGDASRATANITYTFGSLLPFVVDYLGKRIVKRDAEQLIKGLASDVAEERDDGERDGAGSDGGGRDSDAIEDEANGRDGATDGAVPDGSGPRTDRDPTE